MCVIFEEEGSSLETVSDTNIFVAPMVDGRQLTVYENHVALEKGTGGAMILPVPSGRIRLLDFSAAGTAFFAELRSAMPTLVLPPSEEDDCDEASDCDEAEDLDAVMLAVREVGSYYISLAPRLEDLDRIDPGRFAVPSGIKHVLGEHYAIDFSFVVCRFRTTDVQPHPIGYLHERMVGTGALFIPTRHAHGAHPNENDESHADWDHHIFTWGVEPVAFSSTSNSMLPMGDTPSERAAKLSPDLYKAPNTTWVKSGAELGHVVKSSGLLEVLRRNLLDSAEACDATLLVKTVWPSPPAAAASGTHAEVPRVCIRAMARSVNSRRNFLFSYDESTGQVIQCLPGGLAEKHNLQGAYITAFWNEQGIRVAFMPANARHRVAIREMRPLTVEFQCAEPLRHLRVRGEQVVLPLGDGFDELYHAAESDAEVEVGLTWLRPDKQIPSFGGEAITYTLPNEDLLCKIPSTNLDELPKPCSREERAVAVAAMAKEWLQAPAA
eukprot:gnl/TRDRNA2_/TRDRNA2_36299_c0_seq1.p1 gnl/TRDRNA2_/TRDRNA2_36299_c0~~gnl/TRDRNA2_/TRDRNA2_36299_c0_seq1.p1  ORF type:complete len:495 (-),score=87.08 gnl/TRDRNA2_/TRDRNA2_36299_c0_seq1:57-1541(-)